MPYQCYLLQGVTTRRTYIGVTDNMYRRLRQHNREITGGARATQGDVWVVVLCVTGFPHKNAALSFESCWKRMYRKRKKKCFHHRYPGLTYHTWQSPVVQRQIDLHRLVHPNYLPRPVKWCPATLTVNWLETNLRVADLPNLNTNEQLQPEISLGNIS